MSNTNGISKDTPIAEAIQKRYANGAIEALLACLETIKNGHPVMHDGVCFTHGLDNASEVFGIEIEPPIWVDELIEHVKCL